MRQRCAEWRGYPNKTKWAATNGKEQPREISATKAHLNSISEFF